MTILDGLPSGNTIGQRLLFFFQLTRASENAPDFLRRDFEPGSDSRNLLIFPFPDTRDHQLGKLLSHLLKGFFAGDSLGPRTQQRIDVSSRNNFLFERLELVPEIVIIYRSQE